MGTGTFYPEKKTKFFSGLKVPVPIVAPLLLTFNVAYIRSLKLHYIAHVFVLVKFASKTQVISTGFSRPVTTHSR